MDIPRIAREKNAVRHAAFLCVLRQALQQLPISVNLEGILPVGFVKCCKGRDEHRQVLLFIEAAGSYDRFFAAGSVPTGQPLREGIGNHDTLVADPLREKVSGSRRLENNFLRSIVCKVPHCPVTQCVEFPRRIDAQGVNNRCGAAYAGNQKFVDNERHNHIRMEISDRLVDPQGSVNPFCQSVFVSSADVFVRYLSVQCVNLFRGIYCDKQNLMPFFRVVIGHKGRHSFSPSAGQAVRHDRNSHCLYPS